MAVPSRTKLLSSNKYENAVLQADNPLKKGVSGKPLYEEGAFSPYIQKEMFEGTAKERSKETREAYKQIQAEMFHYMLNIKGLPVAHVQGLMANIKRESTFKPDNIAYARDSNNNPIKSKPISFGLFQWTGDRADKMKAAVPDWETNWKGQIDYALGKEKGERRTYYKWRNQEFTSAEDAADVWLNEWERSGDVVADKEKNEEYLRSLYQ
jgi:hypothetical protein|tara:strand:- start:64 stop:693 length:630 start_codon:yes stop_codon:yes gene_type:complete